MRELTCVIVSKKLIARDVYELHLKDTEGDTFDSLIPGQFVNITIEGFYLRRPISVCDVREGRLVIIFKILGEGTAVLAKLEEGEQLKLLSPLGNGFVIEPSVNPVLVGGGVGVPPLFYLARKILEQGIRPKVALGFQSSADVFYEEAFKALGLEVAISTDDGSYGYHGYVSSLVEAKFPEVDNIYACGPIPMLKSLDMFNLGNSQYSLEERMGCGFGGCMGCSIHVESGYKRVCKEGPVFRAKELVW